MKKTTFTSVNKKCTVNVHIDKISKNYYNGKGITSKSPQEIADFEAWRYRNFKKEINIHLQAISKDQKTKMLADNDRYFNRLCKKHGIDETYNKDRAISKIFTCLRNKKLI